MPCYNSQRFIEQSSTSIICQTFVDFELIIIDDNSSDDTRSIVKYFAARDVRIKYYFLNVNSGAGVATNIGINNSKGRYIAFCDSDDIWFPFKLEKQVAFMKQNKLSFTYSPYNLMDGSGRFIGLRRSPSSITYNRTLVQNHIGCLTVVFDTEIHGRLNMPDIRKRQDYGLFLLILKQIRWTRGLNEPLAAYRVSEKSLSSNKFKLLKYNFRIYTEVLSYSKARSMVLFTLFLVIYISTRTLNFQNMAYTIKEAKV